MSNLMKKAKRSNIDLRKRSTIIVETAEIDKMSQAELVQRIKKLNAEIRRERGEDNDLDFMIYEPKVRAIKRMRMVLRDRLSLK